MEFRKMRLLYLLVNSISIMVGAFEYTVNFDGGDCGRTITVSELDVLYLKADPNPITSGGAASCIVTFKTDTQFNVYVQHLSVKDCTVHLYFYDNENTQKYPSQTLTCNPTTDVGGNFQTRTGNLIVRLDKGSGNTKAYSFNLVLTTSTGVVSNNVADTAGGGVGTGAIIGIAVGVVAFLIIIIAVVCFFVCRQMAQQKEEKMRQLQPSVFTTAGSNPSVIIEREGDRHRNRETIPNLEGSYSRRHRPHDPPEDNHYEPIRLPEPKPNGILKGSQRRSRRRNRDGESSGHDNEGYSASVSSTDESCDFNFESYKNSIEKGLPNSQRAKHFSMDPDPVKARRERSERRRQERPGSHTSDSSNDDYGYTNKAFTDDRGRSQSLGRSAGRRRPSDEDDTATDYTRGTRSDRSNRSYSPSRTENSSDTALSRQTSAPTAPQLSASGSQQGSRPGSTRFSHRSKYQRSQGFENKAFSDTSNVSTDYANSKVSYAIMSNGSVDGKSSIRMENIQRGRRTGSLRRDRSVPDKGFSDDGDARSSVKFDLGSDSKLGKVSSKQGDSLGKGSKQLESNRGTNEKENNPKAADRNSEKTIDKPKRSTTEGMDYFQEYTTKKHEDGFSRSSSLRKSKNRETSSSSHNSSNSNRHLSEYQRDDRRSRSRSESRRHDDGYRDSRSEDRYREQKHRSRSADRSHRMSESRSRRRDDYYDDRESDSDDYYRDRNRRSRSSDRRSSRGPDRRSDSRHRSRDHYDDYRSDDSYIRNSRDRGNRDGYRSDHRYDNRGSYRRDKRDGYRSDNRYDHRDGYRSDHRDGYRSDHRDRSNFFRDNEKSSRTATRDRSDSYRSRTTSVGSAYSKQRSSRSRYDR